MPVRNLRLLLVSLGVVLSSFGCSDEPVVETAAGDDPTTPASPVGDEVPTGGLDARVAEATVEGPAAEALRVEPFPAGLLLPGEPISVLLDLVATEAVDLGELPFHSGTTRSEEGSGVLGISGVCGYGWEPDGRPRTATPARPPARSAGSSRAIQSRSG